VFGGLRTRSKQRSTLSRIYSSAVQILYASVMSPRGQTLTLVPVKTGSAHSIIKHLPLLDPVSDNSRALTYVPLISFVYYSLNRNHRAAQLFSFQNPSSVSQKSDLPETIAAWPSLPADLLSASIQPTSVVGEQYSSRLEDSNKSDDATMDSILVVSDDTGRIHCFLDGSYPLGAILVREGSTTSSLRGDPQNSVFFAHQHSQMSGTTLTPTHVELPLLSTRIPRDLAKTSTSARELLWYAMRVLNEMHVVWFGSGTQIGAREPGIRWLKSLNDIQVQMGACRRHHHFSVILSLTFP